MREERLSSVADEWYGEWKKGQCRWCLWWCSNGGSVSMVVDEV